MLYAEGERVRARVFVHPSSAGASAARARAADANMLTVNHSRVSSLPPSQAHGMVSPPPVNINVWSEVALRPTRFPRVVVRAGGWVGVCSCLHAPAPWHRTPHPLGVEAAAAPWHRTPPKHSGTLCGGRRCVRADAANASDTRCPSTRSGETCLIGGSSVLGGMWRRADETDSLYVHVPARASEH